MKVYEGKFHMQGILIAHCLAQIAFMQAWVGKMGGGLRESLACLEARMKEVENILGLGESGKESLFLYLQENIGELLVRVP